MLETTSSCLMRRLQRLVLLADSVYTMKRFNVGNSRRHNMSDERVCFCHRKCVAFFAPRQRLNCDIGGHRKAWKSWKSKLDRIFTELVFGIGFSEIHKLVGSEKLESQSRHFVWDLWNCLCICSGLQLLMDAVREDPSKDATQILKQWKSGQPSCEASRFHENVGFSADEIPLNPMSEWIHVYRLPPYIGAGGWISFALKANIFPRRF